MIVGLDVLGATNLNQTKAAVEKTAVAGKRAIAAGQKLLSSRHPKVRAIGQRAIEAGQKAAAAAQKSVASVTQAQVVTPRGLPVQTLMSPQARTPVAPKIKTLKPSALLRRGG